MLLTLAEAVAAVEAAQQKARELNIRISVAVCDGAGRLVAFQRMDGSGWGGVYGSIGKAIASSAFRRPSGEINPDLAIVQGIMRNEGGHMIPHKGAVPIIRDGITIGACGVGGGTADQDEECARAGVEAIGSD
ncbi:MAG TPA: heme-binding protein [Dehalococcoidia bacterium]|nr:heme-binding protein [Dehalococcoidia bacterium]